MKAAAHRILARRYQAAALRPWAHPPERLRLRAAQHLDFAHAHDMAEASGKPHRRHRTAPAS